MYTLHHVYIGKLNRIIKTTDVTVIVKAGDETEFDITKRSIETTIQ